MPPEKVAAISAVTGIPPELLRPDVFRSVDATEATKLLSVAC